MGEEDMDTTMYEREYEKMPEEDFWEREEDFSRAPVRTTVKQYHTPAQNTRFYRRGNL